MKKQIWCDKQLNHHFHKKLELENIFDPGDIVHSEEKLGCPRNWWEDMHWNLRTIILIIHNGLSVAYINHVFCTEPEYPNNNHLKIYYVAWAHLHTTSLNKIMRKQGFIPSMESPCEKRKISIYKYFHKNYFLLFFVKIKIGKSMWSRQMKIKDLL